jgi:hypothetical protein
MQSLTQWHAERRQETLPQLFQSPLPTRALVNGRWLAALLVGITRVVPTSLLFLFGYLVIVGSNGLGTVLATGLWLLSLGLVLSIGCAGAARRVTKARDLLTVLPLALAVLIVEGIGLSQVLSELPVRTGMDIREVMQAFTLGMSVLNLLLTGLLYHRAVTDLERQRRQDLE